MLKIKQASLLKIVGLLYERVQEQQEIIRELELEINKLSPESNTQQLQEEEMKHFHGEKEIKQLSKKLEKVTEGESHAHTEVVKSVEEQAAEEYQQPQEEEQKKE